MTELNKERVGQMSELLTSLEAVEEVLSKVDLKDWNVSIGSDQEDGNEYCGASIKPELARTALEAQRDMLAAQLSELGVQLS